MHVSFEKMMEKKAKLDTIAGKTKKDAKEANKVHIYVL
jgi:hypothetical protein